MSRVTKFLPRAAHAAMLVAMTLVGASVIWAQGAEDLRITVGKSLVIDYPVDVARISTSNPDIVDAVAVSTREILLHAKTMGVSTIVVWSREGQRTFYNVMVDQNLEPARRLMRDSFPNEEIQVLGSRDSLTLIGRVSAKEISDRAGALAASMAKTVVNNLRIAPAPVEKQVVLKVRFAELDRNKSQQFGMNFLSTGFLNTPAAIGTGNFGGQTIDKLKGSIPGGIPGTTTEFQLKDLLNIFAFRPDLNIGATIKALQNEGVLQILAEPNIVTSMGKEATFLVGGEFPIPVLQGGSGASAVTIQFREFGIRLNFKPEQTENGTLKMYVKPEVSTIDLANSVTLNGFTIPALATRRMETNVELAEGQSFVIGGLIDDRVNEQLSKIPGLSSIPVLGAMFKSRNVSKTKSELIVMVTPEIVDPLNPSDVKPGLNFPKEWLPPVPPKDGAKDGMKKGEVATPVAQPVAAIEIPEQQVITARIASKPASAASATPAASTELKLPAGFSSKDMVARPSVDTLQVPDAPAETATEKLGLAAASEAQPTNEESSRDSAVPSQHTDPVPAAEPTPVAERVTR